MQAALSALRGDATRNTTPSYQQQQHSLSTPSGHPPPDLDPLRLRLVQLIDSITTLHSHLTYLAYHHNPHLPPSTHNPGVLPFPELVQRYQLLVTHLGALMAVVTSSVEKERDRERERERDDGGQGQQGGRRKRDDGTDTKKDRWDSVTVVPATEVDEAKDWIVGMLLRTKQTPDVESTHSLLLSSLPPPFASASASPSAPSAPSSLTLAAPPSTPSLFPQALAAHSAFIARAYDKVSALKEFSSARGEGGAEEWDWKARVEIDAEDEEEEEEGEGMEGVEGGEREGRQEEEKTEEEKKGRSWTAQEVQTYARTGRRPVL